MRQWRQSYNYFLYSSYPTPSLLLSPSCSYEPGKILALQSRPKEKAPKIRLHSDDFRQNPHCKNSSLNSAGPRQLSRRWTGLWGEQMGKAGGAPEGTAPKVLTKLSAQQTLTPNKHPWAAASTGNQRVNGPPCQCFLHTDKPQASPHPDSPHCCLSCDFSLNLRHHSTKSVIHDWFPNFSCSLISPFSHPLYYWTMQEFPETQWTKKSKQNKKAFESTPGPRNLTSQ